MGQTALSFIERENKCSPSPGHADDNFVVVSNSYCDSLIYKPEQSFLLAFGIDQQLHDDYKHKSLGLTVKVDVLETSLTFLKSGSIPSDNSRIYAASDNPEKCTLEAMQEEIVQCAAKVGSDGLFVLFFGGHGIREPATKDWALAPADFDRTLQTSLTTEALSACIKQAQCKAKYILLMLDCCYSGSMASKMTGLSEKPFTLLPSLYVITAGTANESSIAVSSLKHSIFSYFFIRAFQQAKVDPGNLPLSEIFEECQSCSEALSSLIVFVDDQFHLRPGIAKPALVHFDPQTAPMEEVDTGAVPYQSRIEFITKYFSEDAKSSLKLHKYTWNWLHALVKEFPFPLSKLNEKELFWGSYDKDRHVLKAALSLMMHSVATLELTYNRDVVGDPDHFIIAFIEIASLIDLVNAEIQLSPDLLLESCSFYNAVLLKKGINNSGIRELYKRMHSDIKGDKQVRNLS